MSSVWPRDRAAVREGLAAGCSRVGCFPVLRRVAGTVVQRSLPEPRAWARRLPVPLLAV